MSQTSALVEQGYVILTEPPVRKRLERPTMPQLKALGLLARRKLHAAEHATVCRKLHPGTRRVLLARAWVSESGSLLVITVEGRLALQSVYPHVRLFLARTAGYTTLVDRLDAGEVMDEELCSRWRAESGARLSGAWGARREVRGLARALREAA